jgi:hypothetical protein
VTDLATPLANALEAGLTGYARLEPHDALLLDASGVGVLTFSDGVPVAAYHTGTDAAGEAAFSSIAVSGPFRVELYELDPDALEPVHDNASFVVPADGPAERLAGDPDLVERTRERAPQDRLAAASSSAAVESFLEDDDAVEAVRDRARQEARTRAEQWGFDIE